MSATRPRIRTPEPTAVVRWVAPLLAAALAVPFVVHQNSWFEWANAYWLLELQTEHVRATGLPSFFIHGPSQVFYPFLLFYAGLTFGILAYPAAVLGAWPVFAATTVAAFVVAYHGVRWASRGLGVDPTAACLLGLGFVSTPYVVALLYGRGAWTELVAAAAVTLALGGALERALAEQPRRRATAAVVGGVATAAATHNITLLIGLPLATCVLLASLMTADRLYPWRRLFGIGVSAAIGIALCGIFLIPNVWLSGQTFIARAGVNAALFAAVPGAGDPLLILRPWPARPGSEPAGSGLYIQAAAPILIWILLVAVRFPPRRFAVRHAALPALVAGLLLLICNPGWWPSFPAVLQNVQFSFRLVTWLSLAIIVCAAVRFVARPGRLPTALLAVAVAVQIGGAAWIALSTPARATDGTAPLRAADVVARTPPPSFDRRLLQAEQFRLPGTLAKPPQRAYLPERLVDPPVALAFQGRQRPGTYLSTNIVDSPLIRFTGQVNRVGTDVSGFAVLQVTGRTGGRWHSTVRPACTSCLKAVAGQAPAALLLGRVTTGGAALVVAAWFALALLRRARPGGALVRLLDGGSDAAHRAERRVSTVVGRRLAAAGRGAHVRPALWLGVPALLAFYLWTASSSGSPFAFGPGQRDFYNFLAEAFARGQLHLLFDPSPALLALKDPYDPILNAPYRLHDALLYGGHFYFYWGPIPALLVFVPFHLVGLDVPITLVTATFAFVGVAAAALLLRALARRTAPDTPRWALLAGAVAIALGTAIPVTLRRVEIYEAAILGGYMFAFAGVFLLYRSLARDRPSPGLMALASLLLGLAFGCRVTMLVPAALLLLAAVVGLRRGWAAEVGRIRTLTCLLGPAFVIGVSLLAYNQARFGSPLEFGQQYQLAGVEMRGRDLGSTSYMGPGTWFYLFNPPTLSAGFPFVSIDFPQLTYPGTIPAYYNGIESVGGLFVLAPIICGSPLVFLAPRRTWWPVFVSFGVGAALLALVTYSLWGATERYEVDFASFLMIAGLLGWYTALQHRRRLRVPLLVIGGIAIAWTAFAGLAISIRGYKNTLQLSQPATYRILEDVTSPIPTVLARLRDGPIVTDAQGAYGLEDFRPGPGFGAMRFTVTAASARITVAAGRPGPATLRIRSTAGLPSVLVVSTPDTNRVSRWRVPRRDLAVPIVLRRGLNRVQIAAGTASGIQLRDVTVTRAPGKGETGR